MRALVAGPLARSYLQDDLVVTTHLGVWDDRLGGIVARADSGSTLDEVDIEGDVVLIKPDNCIIRIGQRGRFWESVGWSHELATRAEHVCLSTSVAPSGTIRALIPSLGEVSNDTVHSFTETFALIVDGDDSRYIRFDGNVVKSRLLSGGSEIDECTIAADNDGPGALFAADLTGGRQRYYCVDRASGLLYLYDALELNEITEARSSFGSSVGLVSYSRKHDVFGVVRSGNLYIYANEPEAANVSTPEFSDTPHAGQRRVISCTVTGSNDEPCPGRVVGFAATDGDISVLRVTTDADGVAETYWYGPQEPSEDNELTATLVQ